LLVTKPQKSKENCLYVDTGINERIYRGEDLEAYKAQSEEQLEAEMAIQTRCCKFQKRRKLMVKNGHKKGAELQKRTTVSYAQQALSQQ
jgi:hypothetical protein